MPVLNGTRMTVDTEDMLPPVGAHHMRGFCPCCAADVPVEYHCLWAETGETWSSCEICGEDVDLQWPSLFEQPEPRAAEQV